ncbi:MAG: hypothetical protein SF123_10355 [Chloroflexota bacterium]|nr:hypothetical protein [Chloroflexota bacterium]
MIVQTATVAGTNVQRFRQKIMVVALTFVVTASFLFIKANKAESSLPYLSDIPENSRLLPDDLQPITPENVANLELLSVLGKGRIYEAADWSPDGSTIAVGSARGILLFNAADLQAAPRLLLFADLQSAASISEVQYSPDGSQIVAVRGSDVYFWDVSVGNLTHIYRGEESIGAISFSPDLRTLALATEQGVLGSLYLLDLTTWDIDEPSTLIAPMTDLAYSPDGRYVVYSTGNDWSNQLFAYDLVTKTETSLTFPLPPRSYISTWTFIEGGNAIRLITTTPMTPYALWWHVPSPAQFEYQVPNEITPIRASSGAIINHWGSRFDESGRSLALHTELGTIALFQLAGDVGGLKEIDAPGASGGRVHFNPDGTLLFSVDDVQHYLTIHTMRAEVTPTPQQQVSFAFGSWIAQLVLSEAQGIELVTRNLDEINGITISSLETGEQNDLNVTFMQERPDSIKVSADGNRLVVLYPNAIRMIDLATGDAIWSQPNPFALFSSLDDLSVREGTGWVASIDHFNHQATIRNAETGEVIDPVNVPLPPGSEQDFERYALSVDGDLNGHAVTIWDIFTNEIVGLFPYPFVTRAEIWSTGHVYALGYTSRVEPNFPDHQFIVWDWDRNEVLYELNLSRHIYIPWVSGRIVAAQVTNESSLLVLGTYQSNLPRDSYSESDIYFSFWNVETGEQVGGFIPGIYTQDALLFTSDDRLLIAGGPDGLIRIYGVRG